VPRGGSKAPARHWGSLALSGRRREGPAAGNQRGRELVVPCACRHRWVSEWAETRVGAEMRRVGIEKRFAPRKIEVAVERFEFNPGKSNIVRFLNERSSSHGQFHSTPQETITDMVNRAL
jgi:hypothetical protein